LLALGCAAALKNLTTFMIFVSAAHSSGSKLPRHRFLVRLNSITFSHGTIPLTDR
jgi:hypothetical protein